MPVSRMRNVFKFDGFHHTPFWSSDLMLKMKKKEKKKKVIQLLHHGCSQNDSRNAGPGAERFRTTCQTFKIFTLCTVGMFVA